MDAEEPFCFGGNSQQEVKREVKLLQIACRFVPYDQWLLTHVDTAWTIEQVKAWLLSKCIANNSSAPNSSSSSHPNLPPIAPPNKPKTKPSRRPASPIVFAEFSPVGGPIPSPGYDLDGPVKEETVKIKKRRARGRPISPITFAPIGGADGKQSGTDEEPREPEGEVIGMGYEEDDEYESSEEDMDMQLEIDSKPQMGRRAHRNQYLGFHDRAPRPSVDQQSVNQSLSQASSHLPPSTKSGATSKALSPTSLPKSSYSTYHPNLLTLIRFSTGQILEKHYSIVDYELKPYELIEIHRQGVVTKLPREISLKYIKPYWEGWVKALRVVFRETRANVEARLREQERQHAAAAGKRKDKDAPEVEDMLRNALESAYMTKMSTHSKNSHVESARRTMEVLAGGPVKVPTFAGADVALGIAPPSRPKAAKKEKGKRSVGGEQDLYAAGVALSSRHGHDDSSARGGATATPKPAGHNAGANGNHRSKGGKLEWRERWVFIKDGTLHLRKENSETPSTTVQTLPLSALIEIRGAEQLGRTANSMPHNPSQRIVCAKFRTRMTTTKTTVSPSHTKADSLSQSHLVSSVVSAGHTIPSSSKHHSPKPSKGSSMSFSKASSSSTKGNTSSHHRSPGGSTSMTNLFPISFQNASSSSTRGDYTPVTAHPGSSPPSRPKISLNLKPLPPPPPPSSRPVVIQGKARSSSLGVLVNKDTKGKAPMKSPRGPRGPRPPERMTSPPRITSESEIPSGPPSEAASEAPSEAPTDEEGAASDDEAEPSEVTHTVVDDYRRVRSNSERKHPAIVLESDADSDSGSGGTLSSPVFAHSDDDESEGPGSRGYGYGYGHIGGALERRKRREANQKEKGLDGTERQEGDYEENAEADNSYVVVNEDAVRDAGSRAEKPREKPRDSSSRSRLSVGTREKPDPDSEWIVLDLGDDFAFKSFLRVIHRHAPHVIDSSFLSTLPTFQVPTPVPVAPAPTPAFSTPFPSPSQSTPPASFSQWSWNASRQEADRRPIAEEISPIDKPPSDDTPSGPSSPPSVAKSSSSAANASASSSSPPRDSLQYRLPPSPTYGRTLNLPNTRPSPLLPTLGSRKQAESKPLNIQSSAQKTNISTFGALPYPEWRLEVVTKAQRAGMGQLTMAMDQFLWGDNPGLAVLTRELGISLAPLEFVRSPSIQTGGDRGSIGGGEITEDGGEAASLRRQRRRRERKMTLEQENIAIGLESAGTIGGSSIKPLASSPRQGASSSLDSPHGPGLSPSVSLRTDGSSNSPLKLGYVDINSSDSGEESSDAEWVGWMADLHRQARLHLEEEERERLETESAGGSTDTNNYWDYQQQDDHRRYQEERKALEPSGVVVSTSPAISSPQTPQQPGHQQQTPSVSTSSVGRSFGSTTSVATTMGSSTVSSSFQTPATPMTDSRVGPGGNSVLTSPSSNESLNRSRGRRLSFGLSPTDPPSSATSPALSQAGNIIEVTEHHKLERSNSRSNRHRRQMSGLVRDGPALLHYASTGLIGSATSFVGSLSTAREVEFHSTDLTSARRPSMPILPTSSSSSVAPSEALPSPPIASFFSARPEPEPFANVIASGMGGSGVSSAFGRAEGSQMSSDAAPATMPRRSSTAGLIMSSVSSSSVGRSSSMLGKAPSLLRKKDPDIAKSKRAKGKDKEYDQETERQLGKDKSKEQPSKGKDKERTSDVTITQEETTTKSRRPRLSLSTSGSRQSLNQQSSRAISPPPTSPTFAPRGFIRHAKSGQSLMSGEEGGPSAAMARANNPPVKKKKGLVRGRAEKLLQGLESTLDFVDARRSDGVSL